MLTLVDPEGPLSYIIIFLLIVCAGFFAGSESAFSNCNRYKIMVWADDGNKRAKATIKILDRFDNMIVAILTATNIIHVCLSIIATLICVELFKENGGLYATIIMTILVFMFSEIIPKNIAKANADKWSLNAAFPIWIFIYLLYPLILFFSGMIAILRKLIGTKVKEDNFTDDDFQDIVDKKSHEGIIDEEESEIIIAAVDFGDIIVGEVLTKAEDIVALNIDKCSIKYMKKFLFNTNYSRIPVYQGSIDNIIGVLHVRSYLKELYQHGKGNVRNNLLKPYFVDSKVKLDDMLEGFKQHKTHIAIVREKNKTIGMVTMKDVLEELVSDINEIGTSDEINQGDDCE